MIRNGVVVQLLDVVGQFKYENQECKDFSAAKIKLLITYSYVHPVVFSNVKYVSLAAESSENMDED